MASPTTPKFRVSYPNVFKAQKNKLSGEEEYSIQALFPKGTDLNGLKKLAQEAVESKWGKDPKNWPQNLKTPFRNQSDKAKIDKNTGKKILPAGYEEGGVFITLKSKNRPRVVDQQMNEILEPSEFYPGCWARASVRAYAYDTAGNKGVSFGLQNVQKMADGEPFGGRSMPEDDFEPIPVDQMAVSSEEAGASGLFA